MHVYCREKEREREDRIPRATPKTPAGIPEFVGEIPFLALLGPLVRPSSRKTLLSFVLASRYGIMLTYSEEEFYWPVSPEPGKMAVVARAWPPLFGVSA